LDAAASRFLGRVGHWNQSRWSQPAHSTPPVDHQATTRAEVVHALAQRLADLCAAVEGRPPRAVPRLENYLALPDQVRVMVADLLFAGAPADILHAAAVDLDATAERL
jgi:hypothetical protein